MQEQLTALSQKQLDDAQFPEQVAHHIEQDMAEVVSRLDRQELVKDKLCVHLKLLLCARSARPA